MRSTGLSLAVVFWLLALTAPAGAGSVVYTYIDERGVTHFSDIPRDDRFRAVEVRAKNEGKASKPRRDPPLNHGYDGLIVRTAAQHKLEPALIKAVIAAESNFSPVAVSRAGAQGLMQLMPRTAAQLGVEDPFQEHQNIDGGTRYLREMLDRYGDLHRALAAYNAGPQAVDRYRGIPPYKETQAYVKRVLNYYHGYRDDFHR